MENPVRRNRLIRRPTQVLSGTCRKLTLHREISWMHATGKTTSLAWYLSHERVDARIQCMPRPSPPETKGTNSFRKFRVGGSTRVTFPGHWDRPDRTTHPFGTHLHIPHIGSREARERTSTDLGNVSCEHIGGECRRHTPIDIPDRVLVLFVPMSR